MNGNDSETRMWQEQWLCFCQNSWVGFCAPMGIAELEYVQMSELNI